MNRARLELALDILREVNTARRHRHGPACECGCRLFATLAESRLVQLDADARSRADVRQTTIFDAITRRVMCGLVSAELAKLPRQP